jgi:hypothetical protein
LGQNLSELRLSSKHYTCAPQLCSLCLAPVGAGENVADCGLQWSDRLYHAPCANLWLNRVDAQPPTPL